MKTVNLKRVAPWLAIAALIALADQASKGAISASLRFSEVREVTGFFNLVLAHNRGAAFSFLSDAGGWQRMLFIGIAVFATAVIVVMLSRHAGERLFSAGLALILGARSAISATVSRWVTSSTFSTSTHSAGISGLQPGRLGDHGRSGLLILDGMRPAGPARKA